MNDFSMISSERLMARLEDELSTYAAQGLLDTSRLYSQLKWFSQQLGIAVFGYEEIVINLNNHRAELPCNFYLLDSAWLCHSDYREDGFFDEGYSGRVANFQAKSEVYTERECSNVINHGNCKLPDSNNLYPVNIDACVQDTVLAKTVTREYVISDPANGNNGYNRRRYSHPTLLSLNNKKSVRSLCSRDCQNLFSHFPDEISINKQGDNYYLYSTLKNPVIYVKYYSYPIDPESGLPLVPEDAILQEALYWHLVHYFIQGLFINGEETNLESKLKYLTEKREMAMAQAMYLCKLPSYNTLIQMGRRTRNKWNSYEIMGINRHW